MTHRGLVVLLVGSAASAPAPGCVAAARSWSRPAAVAGQDPPDAPARDAEPVELSKDMARLVELHNAERAEEELAALVPEARLVAAAERHAKDMADRDTMDHKGADGTTFLERIKDAGYLPGYAGENVAYGMKTPEGAHKQWMASPGHKRNILKGDYAQVGVAVARSKKGVPYWCVVFASPRPTAAPAPTPAPAPAPEEPRPAPAGEVPPR